MLRTTLIILGAAACAMAFTDEKAMHIEFADGKQNLVAPNRGPSDTKWTLTTCANCKLVLLCKAEVPDCNVVHIEIWDGEKMNDGCEPKRNSYVSKNISISNSMSVRIHTEGSEWPGFCQVSATPPFLGLPEERIDSTEHGIELEQNSLCRCGWANKQGGQRIVGGKETKVNEFPFAVLIIRETVRGFSPFCGGSIITRKHVISAAHCFVNKHPDNLAVLVGEHDMMTNADTASTVKIPVQRIIDHHSYDNRDTSNDISILELTKEIQFNDHIGPVCMPRNMESLVGQHIKVMGWGLKEHKGKQSDVLRKVNLKVINDDVCKTIYGTNAEQQFCTFASNKDSCQGDSGGPLVWLNGKNTFTQVGVVSFGLACASTNPGVNTLVSHYMDWIKENTKGYNMCY